MRNMLLNIRFLWIRIISRARTRTRPRMMLSQSLDIRRRRLRLQIRSWIAVSWYNNLRNLALAIRTNQAVLVLPPLVLTHMAEHHGPVATRIQTSAASQCLGVLVHGVADALIHADGSNAEPN